MTPNPEISGFVLRKEVHVARVRAGTAGGGGNGEGRTVPAVPAGRGLERKDRESVGRETRRWVCGEEAGRAVPLEME